MFFSSQENCNTFVEKMNIVFSSTITKSHYLGQQWYAASTSIKLQRRLTRRILFSLSIFVVMSIIFLCTNQLALATIFLFLSMIWLFVFPYRVRRQLASDIKRSLNEQFKDSLETNVVFVFEENHFSIQEKGKREFIEWNAVLEIIQLPNLYLFKMKGQKSVIIPADACSEQGSISHILEELVRLKGLTKATPKKWMRQYPTF